MPIYLNFSDNKCDGKNNSLLVTDSPKMSFTYEPEEISDDTAATAGKIINKNRCISLLFLLLPNPTVASNLCNQIEDGSFQKTLPDNVTIGEAVLQSLINHTKKDKAWSLKILCALHLLQQYRAISILQPNRFGKVGNILIKKEFEGVEHYFVDRIRIMLYKTCSSHKNQQAIRLINMLGSQSSFTRMETAFLTEIVEKGSQEALVKALNEVANPEDVVRITKDNADSITLLGRNLPTDVRKLKIGKCLIISQEKYEESLSDRDGTQEDVSFLTRTFQKFGCEGRVIVERDVPDGDGLIKVIRKFRDGLGNQHLDFVVVCILAHGRCNENTKIEEIMGVKGDGIPTEDLRAMITDATECPQLIDIPKIFLIQACRGSRENDAYAVKEHTQRIPAQTTLTIEHETDSPVIKPMSGMGILRESWYYVVYSTPKNYVAYRNPIKGSPFIQSFCQNMNDFGDCLTFEKILKRITSDLQRQRPPQSPVYSSVGVPTDLVFTRTK